MTPAQGPGTSRAMLIADDYGLSPEVNDAVLALADARRISGTSALVTAPHFGQAAAALSARSDSLVLGLHLNLTEGSACGAVATVTDGSAFQGLARLIRQSLLRRLDVAAITAEFQRQLARFKTATGRMPDMIDGHQHVHALPQVRQATIALATGADWPAPPMVRNPAAWCEDKLHAPSIVAKATVISVLSRGCNRDFTNAGLPTNTTFAGIANLNDAAAANRDLDTAIGAGRKPRHLVMCHPAIGGDDAIAMRRTAEYEALMALPGLPDRVWHPRRSANGTLAWQFWS